MNPSFYIPVSVTLVAFVAALISSMCGGGARMITTPVWLMLGFPLPVVIGTNTISGSMWTLVAARSYLRGHAVDWRLVVLMVSFGLIGAFFATRLVVSADPKILQRVVGTLILGLVVLVSVQKNFGLEEKESRFSKVATGLCALPLGFYEAFFGSGNGLFTSTLLCSSRGLRLLEALGYYYLLSFTWCLFAACLYVCGGYFDFKLAVFSILGSVFGAAVGLKIGRKRGTKFVKGLFGIVGTVLGLKLLLVQ